MKKTLFLLLFICLCSKPLFSQMHYYHSKGAVAGEFYYVSSWYSYNISGWKYGLVFSNDYGQTISHQHDSMNSPVYGDKIGGLVYTYHPLTSGTKLLRSFNYGIDFDTSWVDPRGFLPGTTAGEIIGLCGQGGYNPWDLYVSSDTGQTFQFKSQIPYYSNSILRSGPKTGHLYRLTTDTLWFSANYGQNFQKYPLDETVRNSIIYNYSDLCPGGAAGEVYIAAFDTGYRYSIYRSTDYGQHFSFRYRLPLYDIFMNYIIDFQGGNTEGEFYYFISYSECYGSFIVDLLDVYSSLDGGLTWQMYHHNLAEPWTGPLGVREESATDAVGLYPNPVRRGAEAVTLTGLSPGRVTIHLMDMSGRVVCVSEAFVAAGSSQAVFSPPGELTPGFYLLMAEQAKGEREYTKLVVR